MRSGRGPRANSDGRGGPEPDPPRTKVLEASVPRLPWVIAIGLGLVVSGTSAAGRTPLLPGASPPPLPSEADPPRSRPAALGRPAAVFLIRSVLIALHQANQTGNYTVLRDISAPDFARANTAARLADIFAPQREKQIDLSEAAILDPDLTEPPEITAQGHLRLAGSVRSFDNQVEFELVFSPVEGRWRLGGIATNILPLPAAAPARPDPGRPPALRTSTAPGPAS